ncbi:MAG: HAMP domain-containing protein [Eubacterium sp.]|nr:HAMP domain-containing protein [Eubacterium sp.]
MTSLTAIVIPTVLIVALAAIVFTLSSAQIIDFPSASQVEYSTLNQLQWSQAVSDITEKLVGSDQNSVKLKRLESIIGRLEKTGAFIYITKNGEEFYKTPDGGDILEKAYSVSSDDDGFNSYYLGDNGLSVMSRFNDGTTEYRLVIVNESYTLPKVVLDNENIWGVLISRTSIAIGAVIIVFILAIVIISLITSKTIVGPIEQITAGANEIANGNFDCEIKYKSKNELGQLADSFNNMRLRVKESIERQRQADQKQKEMIAGIAHDLRTPLTSVKGYLEGLRDGIADTPEKQKRYMDTIYSSTCSTEKILDDLLAFSKLELGGTTLNCESVTVADFLEFAEGLREELTKRDFDLEIIDRTKTSPVLYLDTDRFTRVINNIISNSIRYRRPDVKGKITLTIIEYQKTVLIELKDNGMGVDKESLPRIFDTLYRADKARTNVREGSGLGLSICKQIVELHGGLIWAQSEPGNGLAILISLPIGKAS